MFGLVIDDGQPSQTALTAAAARAAHLIVDDDPSIFDDSLAYALLGDRAEEFVGYHRAYGTHDVLAGARAIVTTRSHYTEERLAEAVHDGVTQYVILGAGLDTFAYRSDLAARVRVFEVDHPTTQEWKRRRLVTASIKVPANVAFVAVDFEADSAADRLVAEGFDPTLPAFVSWLGVTMYLTREAIGQTLAMIGGFAAGTELVVEHMMPAGLRDADGDAYVEALMPAVAERGEPWLTFLGPDEMCRLLARQGLSPTEHVHQRDAVDAALWRRRDALHPIELPLLTRAGVGIV